MSFIKVTDNFLGIIGCQTLHFTHILGFVEQSSCAAQHNSLPDDNSEQVPPDPIPNSEVKLLSADGSVGVPM